MSTSPRDPTRLREDLYARLPDAVGAVVRRIVGAGAAHGAVYAVGGVVRDLILGRDLVDVDLATEADAIATLSEAAIGAKLTIHARFRTAAMLVAGTRIDVATTRGERYARPGGLPSVSTPAGIEDDLHRRDFAINALALRLDGDARLIDPSGGLADIDGRLIRVLHEASLVDDPSRIYRAFRFGARLGFRIEPHTRMLLAAGLPYVAMVGGARLRRELELTLLEPTGGTALEAAYRAGALTAIAEGLIWDPKASAALARGAPAGSTLAELGFALLAGLTAPYEARRICRRLRLRRREAAAVMAIEPMREAARMLGRTEAKPSGVVVLLDRYPAAAVAALAAYSSEPIVHHLTLRYLDEWRDEKPLLNGNDLQALGIPAGPQIQNALQLIRAARLDGWASDRDDERALAMRFAKSIRDAGTAHFPSEMHANGP